MSPAIQSGGLVLIIDDDSYSSALLASGLEKHGHRIQIASSGPQGLEMARTLHPVAITLDIMMPGMDGWSVLSALKADPATSEIPVIIVTMLNDRQLGFALGAAEFLTKPVDQQQLRDIIGKMPMPRGIGILPMIQMLVLLTAKTDHLLKGRDPESFGNEDGGFSFNGLLRGLNVVSTITAILEPDKDGTLHLPLPLELRHGKIRVEAKLEFAPVDACDSERQARLAAVMKRIRARNPFNLIKDPVAWQRDMQEDVKPIPQFEVINPFANMH